MSPTFSRSLRSPGKHQGGQALVEFTFVLVFWVLLVVLTLEMFLFLHTYNVLADAAKEGVRYAIVHGTNNSSPCGPVTCTDVTGPPAPPGTVPGYGNSYGVVKSYAQYSLHDTTNMVVAINYPGGDATPANKTPNRVQVTVSYPYQPLFGLGWPTVTLNASAEGRIMN